LTRKFNESLVFDPSEVHMAYTIRDPVRNGKFFKIQMKCFCAVNVSVHASGAVDRWVEHLSGQTKDYEIGSCCFSPKHAALRSKSRD
jgi:hypothetical protein